MKMQKLLNPKAGDLAVMNSLPDAAVFKVVKVEGFTVTVVDVTLDGENAALQYTDKSLLLKPTKTQLQASGVA